MHKLSFRCCSYSSTISKRNDLEGFGIVPLFLLWMISTFFFIGLLFVRDFHAVPHACIFNAVKDIVFHPPPFSALVKSGLLAVHCSHLLRWGDGARPVPRRHLPGLGECGFFGPLTRCREGSLEMVGIELTQNTRNCVSCPKTKRAADPVRPRRSLT